MLLVPLSGTRLVAAAALNVQIYYLQQWIDVYGGGQSEKLVGQWLRESGADRSRIFLATKFGTSDSRRTSACVEDHAGLFWDRETKVSSMTARSDPDYVRQCIEVRSSALPLDPDRAFASHRSRSSASAPFPTCTSASRSPHH
jgi:aryl-alcohol dehydrogenase-like predicted oxidoreductase